MRFFIVATVLLGTLVAARPAPDIPEDDPLSVSVSVTPLYRQYELLPGRGRDQRYTCQVMLHDPNDPKKVRGGVWLTLSPDDRRQKTEKVGPLEISLGADIDAAETRAVTEYVIRREGKLVLRGRNVTRF